MKHREKSQVEIWEEFDRHMNEHGYHVHSHNDSYMGCGSVAFQDDRFAPIFSLHVWGGNIAENFVSIHVEDRNGNPILDGPTAAIYSMSDTGDAKQNMLVFSKIAPFAHR